MEKICKTCDYGSTNELKDIICTNSHSANCCEFMGENNNCPQWKAQGHKFGDEFWSESAAAEERSRKAKEYIYNIGLSMEQQ